MTALANFIGPFIFGAAVAETIGGIVDSDSITLQILIAALASAIVWNLFTWYMGFPSSSSHALVGGLIGAVLIAAGWQAINMDEMKKILIALFTSPILGFIFGFLILRLIFLLSWNATPRINGFFRLGLALS